MATARLLLFALLGLAFGSFLTVVVHRAPRNESVVAGRSRCPSCGAVIGARDNVPLLSYVLLRGRCRHCSVTISPEYPLTEISSALLFLAAAAQFEDTYLAVVMAVFMGLLMAMALTDLRSRLIPNAVAYPSLVVFPIALAAGAAMGSGIDLVGALLGFLAFGGGLLALAVAVPGGMGMGDVKLAALIGLVLGSRSLAAVAVALGVAVLTGGIWGLASLAAGRSRKSAMPFGPFLAAGGVVATLWGSHLASAYLSLLG